MPDHRDLTNPPPTDIWLGKQRSMWPVLAFTNEDQVARWLQEGQPGERRVWKVDTMTLSEVELIPPVPAGLRAVEG
jgi:hypothetical protein